MSKKTVFKRILRSPQTLKLQGDSRFQPSEFGETPLPESGALEESQKTTPPLKRPQQRETIEMNRPDERWSSDAAGQSADADQPKGDVPPSDAAESPAADIDTGGGGGGCVGGGQSASRPEIYTDVSICRTLGIKRRILAEARTAATRGRDWDVVGEEVGMTRRWVEDFALELGIVLDSPEGSLEQVSGRYVSVSLVGTTPNKCLVQVELEATKTREFARTRNVMDYPIHYKEVFCCERILLPSDVHLEWAAAPNEVKY